MHQVGIGLDVDFHLAKRYYDQALELSPRSIVPVTLALWSLHFTTAWRELAQHGHVPTPEAVAALDWDRAYSVVAKYASFEYIDSLIEVCRAFRVYSRCADWSTFVLQGREVEILTSLLGLLAVLLLARRMR